MSEEWEIEIGRKKGGRREEEGRRKGGGINIQKNLSMIFEEVEYIEIEMRLVDIPFPLLHPINHKMNHEEVELDWREERGT